jgi:Fe-S-cluster-containing hydrogenase component 2/CRP-like cAMP-binding protein
MAKQVMPPARLESRSTDVPFTDDVLPKISLFAQLKRKVSLDKYPGTLAIRRFRRGEVICRQGDMGWTAFYAMTDEDALALRDGQLQKMPEGRDKRFVQVEADALRKRINQKGTATDPQRVATFYLTLASPTPVTKQGLVERLVGRVVGKKTESQESRPLTIAIDAPSAIDFESKQATLHEGEMFGEATCLYGRPRSATVIADCDCYMLEMLRNILEQVQKDPAYKARMDDLNVKRVFQLHLRRLSLFSDLSDNEFASLRDEIKLETYDPGQVLYDEHEQSDDLFVIRSGLVRVLKKASPLLSQENVRDWQRLATTLVEAEKAPTTPAGKVWSLLPAPAKAAAQAASASRSIPRAERQALLNGLNQVLKDNKFPDAKELQALTTTETFKAKVEGFPEKRKDWSDQDCRRYNRLVLDSLLSTAVREHRRRVGPDCVLFYCSQGEFVGEANLMEGVPLRGETCVAHGHPKDLGTAAEAGPVEVVRIPREAFAPLMEGNPDLRRKIERKIAERRRQTQERVRVPVFDDTKQIHLSENFEKLGLIQGQRLMLIDLTRCTRCDECVRACVETHADGRSRLYLDGPRFGNYLVPVSCRSCLDPVCMIGCPVSSIHRGDNGQMVIEDWCIGCGLCADNCPYGSIRMDDIGIIPEDARGWRYLPQSALGEAKWMLPRYGDRRWLEGMGPFRNDRQFRETLTRFLKKKRAVNPTGAASSAAFSLAEFVMENPLAAVGRVGEPVCFRYEFTLPREAFQRTNQFKLEVTSPDPNLLVWVNGQEVHPGEKPRGGRREFWLPPKPAAPAKPAAGEAAAPPPPPERAPQLLRPGRNVIAVRVLPDTGGDDVFLKARLDEIRKPKVAAEITEEIIQKPVLSRAVVCDLCSGRLGRVPACVDACPHDAAMRVDARSEFPVT